MDINNMQTQLDVIQGNIVNLAKSVTQMANYFTEIAKDQMATRSRLSKLEQNMGELTVSVSFLKQKESERMSSQIKRNPTTHTVSMLYTDENDDSDHVAICDRIEALLNEEPRRQPSFSGDENKENAGISPCTRPPVFTGDRPTPVSLAKHLAEASIEVCRRPPVPLRARPSPAGTPLSESSIHRRPPVLGSSRPSPARPQTEANDVARRPPVDSGDRPPRYLAKFEIDVSGCKGGSPPVYTLLPLSEETDEWKEEEEDVALASARKQEKWKKKDLSKVKCFNYGELGHYAN